MTITNPVTPLPPYVPPYGAYTEITPFTFRDGQTFLEQWYLLQVYITDTLLPFIDENFAELYDAFNTQMQALIDQVNAALDAQDQELQDAIDSIINNSIEVQDPVMAGIISDVNSATTQVLIGLYDTKHQFNAKDFATLQAAIDATPAGGILFIPNDRTWNISAALNVSKSMRIYGTNSLIVQATAAVGAFNITASNVRIEGLHIKGVQSATSSTKFDNAINVIGASIGQALTGIHIGNNVIEHWAYGGILLNYVNNFDVQNNEIYDIGYIALGTLSCAFGQIIANNIHDILQSTGYVNSYGIAITRDNSLDIVTAPRSHDINIVDNIIQNVVKWEGIDTHAGQALTIVNNRIYNCNIGIALVGCPNPSGVTTWAPLGIICIGNYVDSTVTDGSRQTGIELIGAGVTTGSPTEYATGIISNNIVIGYGLDNNVSSAGIQVYNTRGVIISNNRIIAACTSAIQLYSDNDNCQIKDNVVIDVWTNTGAFAAMIYIRSAFNNAVLSGNTLSVGNKVATKVNDRGLYVATTLNVSLIDAGGNKWDTATLPMSGHATIWKSSFYGALAIIKPGPAPANATDLPTAIALVNNLKASLIALGLTT